jgi:dTDP-4-dehydrorhamnose 3,5-epimerase-like enzyme
MTKREEHKIYQVTRKIITDSRGWFLKVIDGNEPGNPFDCEVYFTSAKPGENKGGHYHNVANEWFTLITGEAVLKLTDIESNESSTLNLHSEKPETVFIPSGVAHLFVNTGDRDFLLVAFTDTKYLPEDTIPYQF